MDIPETVAPDQPIGCYGPQAGADTRCTLTDPAGEAGESTGRRPEDAYGRMLAYVYINTNNNGSYKHLFNEDFIEQGFARTTIFSHAYRRQCERLQEEAEERRACSSTEPVIESIKAVWLSRARRAGITLRTPSAMVVVTIASKPPGTAAMTSSLPTWSSSLWR